MARSNKDNDRNHTNFRRMSEDGEHEPIPTSPTTAADTATNEDPPMIDDFFDTSTSAHNKCASSQYPPTSERFIFDGDEEDAFISPTSPTSPYLDSAYDYHHHHRHPTTAITEPLLRLAGEERCHYPDNHSEDDDDLTEEFDFLEYEYF